jgi:hypothetical protein
MDILVGYTGFVGSNLYLQHNFGAVFNSKNIQEAFNAGTDLCVYSGVRAEKFLANKEPDKDLDIIKNAIENIKRINPQRLILVSTIDVLKNPNGVDEATAVATDGLHPYGSNRYILEQWVRENIQNHHIIRLPGLFGKNIKKNFIYDLIHILPSMLNEGKFMELSGKEALIARHYIKQDNGFYKCTYQTEHERDALKLAFDRLGFSALNFTDSRGIFQFYNLAYLWEHIQIAIQNNIRLLHLAVEPVTVNEIYKAVKGCDFVNEVSQVVPKYDFRTRYSELFGGSNGYIFTKQQVLNDIIRFVEDEGR